MQRLSIVLLVCLLATSLCLIASDKSKEKSTKNSDNDPQAFVKSLWENFKTKNDKGFDASMTADAWMADQRGVEERSAILSDLRTCNISSYDLSDFKQAQAGKDAVVVTYQAKVDGMCGNDKLPPHIVASDVLVKRAGKWQSLYHQETPVESK